MLLFAESVVCHWFDCCSLMEAVPSASSARSAFGHKAFPLITYPQSQPSPVLGCCCISPAHPDSSVRHLINLFSSQTFPSCITCSSSVAEILENRWLRSPLAMPPIKLTLCYSLVSVTCALNYLGESCLPTVCHDLGASWFFPIRFLHWPRQSVMPRHRTVPPVHPNSLMSIPQLFPSEPSSLTSLHLCLRLSVPRYSSPI